MIFSLYLHVPYKNLRFSLKHYYRYLYSKNKKKCTSIIFLSFACVQNCFKHVQGFLKLVLSGGGNAYSWRVFYVITKQTFHFFLVCIPQKPHSYNRWYLCSQWTYWLEILCVLNLALPVLCISESCIEIKI